MRAPTILLVSPAFHGYWKAIEASLNVAGYEVRTHIYDAPGTVADRIRNKLAHELPEKYRPASSATVSVAVNDTTRTGCTTSLISVNV